MPTQLVWFKRDLRVADHAPLREAARRGPCLCVYVYEPEVLATPEFDSSHLVFINQSLANLRESLRRLGADLIVRTGRLPDVFAELHAEHAFATIWAHEETGQAITYERDKRVARWCRNQGVNFYEAPANGVVRRLKSRDGWASSWRQRMQSPTLPEPERVVGVSAVQPGELLGPEEHGLPPSSKHEAQHGGETTGKETLQSFLRERGVLYRSDMSSPNEGWEGCSRLSPYLAFGNLSVRQAYQAATRRAAEVRSLRANGGGDAEQLSAWSESLKSFESRLSWHCHFIQKLEDEPAIEFENFNHAYDGLRPDIDKPADDGATWNDEAFAAWKEGRTGYPIIDASMRCLHATGWINFRMRAMLASFTSYHLWLHWREPAKYLASQFLDYEPGIHYSQYQMQAGTAGINTTRIYSPPKQTLDNDPEGRFIHRWVPELASMPAEHLPEPWNMPPLLQQDIGCVIGRDYPAPIVDHTTAYRTARDRMHAFKKTDAARAEARRVYQKHGSRKRPMRRGAK